MSSNPHPQVPLHESAQLAVLDTNIALDLFLFNDPRIANLRDKIATKQLTWIATAHMRNELERVLAYSHIVAKLNFYEKTAADILLAFDHHAQLSKAPIAKSPYTCKDADDQVFIDLACHLAGQTSRDGKIEKVHLISKDKAVLSMRKRLGKLSVCVSATFSD